jgi:hypothetical protein
VGNFVNGRLESRANAAGVKLASLAKFCDIKSSDQKSLLHYVLCVLEKSVPDVLRLEEDFTCAIAASKISLACV